jgi:hypothetical protein
MVSESWNANNIDPISGDEKPQLMDLDLKNENCMMNFKYL